VIAVVDYGMGNLRSVQNALQKVGANARIVSAREDVLSADALVLPGVGAFGDCMKNLESLNLTEAIREFIAMERPFLGICLGLQALFEESEESAGVRGLGIFEGNVPRFAQNGLKVPHMGWNNVRFLRPECPILAGVPSESFVYFVHSYYVAPKSREIVCGETDYGATFCSMIWHENVFATQFHPEKSQRIGLKMLENFVKRAEAKD
jgi:glutamine amidotransferase